MVKGIEGKREIMKRMAMKYKNKCRKCGKELKSGDVAYGERNKFLKRWLFECPCCHHKSAGKHTKEDETLDFDELEAILGIAEATGVKDTESDVSEKKEQMKKDESYNNSSYLEFLAINARWRMK